MTEDAWSRTAVGWHVSFAVFAAVTVVVVLDDSGTTAVERVLAVGLVVVLLAWYAVTGARVLLREPATRLGLIYVLGAAPAVVAIFALSPAGGILLFGLYPQLWVLLPARRAITGSVLLTVAVSAVAATAAGSSATVVLITLAGGPVAILLGTWIARIIKQSTERADLVRELSATRAELAAVSHEAGVLAERERLARDLHDTVAQGFTSILLLLHAARSTPPGDHHLALAEQTTRENLAEVRALVAELTPVALADATLPAALARLTERIGHELGITATMSTTGRQQPLPQALDVVLLRATQEALANVRKHSGASMVSVELTYADTAVSLQVRDDGRGLPPSTTTGGFGLAGLRERAHSVGGSVTVRSGPGCTVLVELPLNAA
ncbi:MAG TPA: sensor histidine kinase [Pseudonocardiaceae bacterium]